MEQVAPMAKLDDEDFSLNETTEAKAGDTLLGNKANAARIVHRAHSPYYTKRNNNQMPNRRRIIFKNGDYNVSQIHVSERRRRYLQDIFTTLVDARWRWTTLAFVLSFMLSWLAFGAVWWFIAYNHEDLLPENLNNTEWHPCVTNIDGFASSFLFSIETQHSTGYGSRVPTQYCLEAIICMCLQSIIGVMIQAFMVGIVFAKMARPKKRQITLLFSRNCIVCQRDGQLCLLFRIGDMRDKSHLINCSLRAYLVKPKKTLEGELLVPYFYKLAISVDAYDSNIFMIWPMTVVHRIDSSSPMYSLNATDLLHQKLELLVILEGTTESTGQTTQARTSYLSSEIMWGHRFEPMVKFNRQKLVYEVDYALFHNVFPIDTPLCSARELDFIIATQACQPDEQQRPAT